MLFNLIEKLNFLQDSVFQKRRAAGKLMIREKEDIDVAILLIALLSIAVWYAALQEFLKPERKQSNRKIMTLTSTGTLPVVLTISFFQDLAIF